MLVACRLAGLSALRMSISPPPNGRDNHRAARSASVRRLEAEDEVADAAMLSTVSDRLASAKDAADAALAMLRQWETDTDANDDGDARGR
jgi:hypothetical protein